MNSTLWIVLVLYTMSLLYALWRLMMAKPYRRWPKLAVVLPGFAVHTWYLCQRGLSTGRCPVSNLFETLVFVAWCLVALHLVVTSVGKINYVTVFYMPIVLTVLLSALLVAQDRPTFQGWKETSWLGFHASVIILGYAAFSLAGAVGLMYIVQESQLRRRRLGTSFMLLPPMMRLESFLGGLVVAGFSLLSLGLISGWFGVRATQADLTQGDAKLLWSVGVWALYLTLLAGRYFLGKSGRWMAWMTLMGCVFVLSTFWMSNALSSFHRY